MTINELKKTLEEITIELENLECLLEPLEAAYDIAVTEYSINPMIKTYYQHESAKADFFEVKGRYDLLKDIEQNLFNLIADIGLYERSYK